MLQPSVRGDFGQNALLAARANPALLAVAVFAAFAATAWLRPLSLPDEGRYVGVAFEMLSSGNWLVPTLDTLPYFHKPPLFYWTTAASLATFGINEWAARLASLLAATGCAVGLHRFLRRWAGERQAALALLVLLTTPFFYGGAQFANMDMLVAACIAGTVLCTAHAVLAGDADGRPARPALAAAYALGALGLLAKGLIGVVIPGMIIVIWLLLMRRVGAILRLVWLPGVVLFAALALPWLVLMQARFPGFFHYFFVYQHFERYAAQGFNNPRPFWFLVAGFAGATLPWCVFLPRAALDKRRSHVDSGARQVQALMWIWLIVTLVFFSIPNSKLIGYVLVAVPPLAALVADGLRRAAASELQTRTWALRIALLAIAIDAAALLTVNGLDRSSDNTRNLAARLGSLVTSSDDAVVAVDTYPFSLGFYLGHPLPLIVVEAWHEEWVMQKDTWRRELVEAAEFAPDRGKRLLLELKALPRFLDCSERPVWLIVPNAIAERFSGPAGLEHIAEVGGDGIWRKTPSGASGRRGECQP
jgi:4-amino-4-deoxy-L-arabinose transferase-like glycosyltransferase